MERTRALRIASWAVILILTSAIEAAFRRSSAEVMAEAAGSFLSGLTAEQRAKATFGFDDEQRLDWHYIPRARKGIPIKELDQTQRRLAQELLKAGLSQRGYFKATTIMELETVLRELESSSTRDPELYFFSVFGTPSAKDRWGWRVEGHHLSLNFTVVAGGLVATTPAFLGSNPAEVRQGPRQGLRVLGVEEDIARELIGSLNDKQRATAVFAAQALPDIETRNAKTVDPLDPVGITASELNRQQMDILMKLVNEYISAMPADLAASRMDKLRRAGLEKIRFGWAGGIARGQPHYYRIQGPTFLIEYDNTQNNANHIHTVWRDFNGDFGRDLLREHYRDTPHKR